MIVGRRHVDAFQLRSRRRLPAGGRARHRARLPPPGRRHPRSRLCDPGSALSTRARPSGPRSTVRAVRPSRRPRVPFERYSLMPTPATPALLAELVDSYARAAGHIVEGGLDGVEILASMGYLIAQFLNPRVNRRDDAYGGNLENRMRFLVEILEAVRARIGCDPILGVRISDADATPGAMDSGEVLESLPGAGGPGSCRLCQRHWRQHADGAGLDREVVPPMAIEPGHVARLRGNLETASVVAGPGGRTNQPAPTSPRTSLPAVRPT